jgi:hypothetical protein
MRNLVTVHGMNNVKIKNIVLHRILLLSMSLVKIGNHKFIHSQKCEISSYIWKCISEETINWDKNYALS